MTSNQRRSVLLEEKVPLKPGTPRTTQTVRTPVTNTPSTKQPTDGRRRELTEREKEEIAREHDEYEVRRWRDESILIPFLKKTDWDTIPVENQLAIVAYWKEKTPKWSNRIWVYNELISNKYGTDWRYINNVLNNVLGRLQPPAPNTSLDESNFYNNQFPYAATVVWWASLYSITLTSHPIWYNRVYIQQPDQTAVLQGRELIEDGKDALGSPSTLATIITVIGAVIGIAMLAKSHI